MNLIKSIKSLYLSPVKFLLQTFLFGLLYTSILRFVFYLYFLEQSGDSNFRDIAKSFLTGIRFDTVVVLTLLLPVILFFLLASVIFQIKLKRNFEKYSLITYLTTIFSLFTIFHLSDISFFANFDSRLNYLAYEYVGEGNMVMDMIILQPQYYVVIASWIILTLLFYRFFKNRHRVIEQDKLSDRKDVLIYFMILIFSLAGIRGTFGIAPLDWGTAYISQNHFINQMTLNPIYTLTRSIQEDNFDPRLSYLRENERFRFVNFSEALKTTQDMLSARNETLLDSLNSIYRTKFQPRAKFSFEPNIVLIIMESFSARNIGALGSAKQLTPYFDSLAADGILFNNFYSASNRSNYGLGALLCSFPAMPGRAILKRYNAMHPFLSFSEILKRRNYYNGFLYGGDISFDNMQGFFRQKGYDKFWGDDNFDDSLNFSKWGIPDHILFDQAGLIIDSLPRPFQLTIFTLSNHEPFDLPDSSLMKHFDNLDSSKEFNGMIYSDHALGKFMKEVKKVFKRPIIAKLAPNVTDISAIALAAEQGGADALAIINSLIGTSIDIETNKPVLTNNNGGLTGPAIKPIALAMVNIVYNKCRLPIIGIGGISNYSDVVEFLLCGATAVQIGTALFVDPFLPLKIIDDLKKYLKKKKLGSVNELIGQVRKY